MLTAVGAHAAPHAVGQTVDGVVADGERFAAFAPSVGVTRVLDTQTGTSFDVATPRCESEGFAAIIAIGGGQLAWWCYSAPIELLDLRSRVVRIPPGQAAWLADEWDPTALGDGWAITWRAIGRYWLLGYEYDVGHSDSRERALAYNWRTGELRRNAPGNRYRAASPDARSLGRRLCRPLHRHRSPQSPDEERPPFLDFEYQRPYALAEILRVTRTRDHINEVETLSLERCGRRRGTRLGPYVRHSEQLGSGWATWNSGRYVRAYDARHRRRRQWEFPPPVEVTHTAARVFVATGTTPATVYTDRLRR